MDEPAARKHRSAGLFISRGSAAPCPYLPGRRAVYEYAIPGALAPEKYQRLMDAGFRRSGDVVYRPVCEGCRECVPIRVAVQEFEPSRSQRRVRRRNVDVEMRIGPPVLTDEKHALFARYLREQHDGSMSDRREDLEEFLYRSGTETLEMTYHVGSRLVAVGIVDVCPISLSSVYFYFEPAESRRSLGILGGLFEIDECRRRGLPYWYLGYYIRDCRRMNYKACFRPHELLDSSGGWVRA